MGAVRPRPKNKKRAQNAHLIIPSFVYRQDGYELSYEIEGIISQMDEVVKVKISFPRLISTAGFDRIPLSSHFRGESL
jgi:hypothetical protein